MWIVLAMLATLGAASSAETYRLSDEKGWQNVAGDPESEYLLAISQIKQQLLTGTDADIVGALEALKKDFPGMAGTEIDGYIEAEKLYADANWYKAATAYKKFIDAWPDSVLQPAAMERLYSIATAYLQGQKRVFIKILKLPAFDTGVDLMYDVADRAGNSPMGLRALTTLAESQEQKKLFLDAYDTWQQIADQWPTGKTRQTATLRMAQALHASYDGVQYDDSLIEKARAYFQDYNNQYPEDAARLGVPETINLINEQLAYKQYETGFYYERTGKSDVASRYYQKVLKDWPDSKAATMAQARMAPDAVSPIKMTTRRRGIDITIVFLDNWFGLKPLFNRDKNK
jgi:outer membrane protein assembly factor BamD (BamD/ComL family)